MLAAIISPSPVHAADAKWTVMVFLNADNNLEPFGIRDYLKSRGWAALLM